MIDVQKRLGELGLAVDAQTAEKLWKYNEMLADWNTRMNLIGPTDPDTAFERHFVDSLAPLGIAGVLPEGESLLDVGTGAGFPGMAIAIVRPQTPVTLLDSLEKRLAFLRAVAEELGLSNVRFVHARAEDAARQEELREGFACVTARAVAALPTLLEYLLPFARVGGRVVCYKGPQAADELAVGARAAALLGGDKPFLLDTLIPGHEDWRHCVVICRKREKTVRQYPRQAGTPGRKPLG